MDIRETLRTLPEKISKYGFTAEQERALTEYSLFFKEREDLIELAQKYHYEIFESENPMLDDPCTLSENDGREEGLLFAMMYLARFERLEEILAKRGIPARYKESTKMHMHNLMLRNYTRFGTYGYSDMYRDAMVQYLQPRTYTLGRLSFEMSKFSAPYIVYRSKKDGHTVPIALSGFFYNESGRRVLKGDEQSGFEPSVTKVDGGIKGYTYTEKGFLIQKPIFLAQDEYECVLAKGDDVLSVHIPGNEKMTSEKVSDGFCQAENFFRTYYPEKNFKAYVCSSWLLDTDLEQMLKPESNILHFQSRFRIVMSHINDFALYWNIFQMEEFVPIEKLKPTNGFQQRILDWLSSGKLLYSGNGYILKQ